MKWFLVRYIYEIVCGDGNYKSQFDEQLRLMLALNSAEALEKAKESADSFHLPFKNCTGELVTWKFICIADLHEIQTPDDGAEIASIMHEPIDVPAFLDQVEKRQTFLKEHIQITTSELDCFDN